MHDVLDFRAFERWRFSAPTERRQIHRRSMRINNTDNYHRRGPLGTKVGTAVRSIMRHHDYTRRPHLLPAVHFSPAYTSGAGNRVIFHSSHSVLGGLFLVPAMVLRLAKCQ